jgi:hypothetical protein
MKSSLDHICKPEKMKPICRHALTALFAALLQLSLSNNPAHADTIFVTTNIGASETIGEYTT